MVVCVGVVDDHRAMLLGTTAIINCQPGMHVVAAGRTAAELVSFRQRMDVILLDLTLADGTSPAQNIFALSRTGARILAYTSGESPHVIREAADAGAIGMIQKSEDTPQIVAAVRAAAHGKVVTAMDWAAVVDQGFAHANLSMREAEVLSLYASGETAERVAQVLFVSRETVLDHIRRIRAKYAAVDRPAPTKVDLFRRAVEDGLVQPGA